MRNARRRRVVGAAAVAIVAAVFAGVLSIAPAAVAQTAPADTTAPPAPAATPPPPAVPLHQPAEWETLSAGLPEEYRAGGLGGVRYNRVDGPAVTAGIKVYNEVNPLPLMRAQATYAFSRERLLAEFGADVPIGRHGIVTVGGTAYRRTASEDAWIVGETENTIFAILSRKDYRDYYEAEGFEGHLALAPGRDAGFTVGFHVEDQRSLEVKTRVAVWGEDDLFRENPPIEEGEEGLWFASARVGPAVIPAGGGSRIVVRYERAGAPIERDFDYGRIHAQGNLRARLTPDQGFRVRAIAASTREGVLPSQKVWDLGGIGTLRGEPFQSRSGDQFYLVNAEYSHLVRRNLNGVAFLDWGDAFFGSGGWSTSRPALDGGIGLKIGDGPAMVTLARSLQRSDAPWLVGVRLGGSWE